ncbi:MAG: hypothetical protein LLF96_07485 [Eubacteriales bacterium]|nr:hypothetical protein [Eubacteriales bacterium]
MKWFRKLYVWSMNIKLYMAFYFFIIAFAMGIVELISGGDSLKLLTLLEMALACTVIGLMQIVLLNDSVDYSKGIVFGRSVAWVALSTGATVGVALLFGWFTGYPAWSLPAFAAFLLISLTLTLLGLKFEQEADTVYLNENLRKFKQKQ